MKFTIYMEPVAKGRARTCVRGDFVHSYTPSKTKEAEEFIRMQVVKYRGFKPGIPLHVAIHFFLTKPKSAKKRVSHTVKPDLDNLTKLVLDSLNKIMWHDDAQIVSLYSEKAYDSPARIEIEVNEVQQ